MGAFFPPFRIDPWLGGVSFLLGSRVKATLWDMVAQLRSEVAGWMRWHSRRAPCKVEKEG